MDGEIRFAREWAMPSPDTFTIRPIADLLRRWIPDAWAVIDPFARNSRAATVTNDLDPHTSAQNHDDAIVFLDRQLAERGAGWFDAALLDPPYSPRQISEVYKSIGRAVSTEDTQNARLYRECKVRLAALLRQGGIAVTCGWNSMGFGPQLGFTLCEVLLVPCGGAHNDYIVVVETKDGGRMKVKQQIGDRRFCQHPKGRGICGIKRPCPDHQRHEPSVSPTPQPPEPGPQQGAA